MLQRRSEIGRVLARAGADLQGSLSIRKDSFQLREDRLAVAFAGFGEGLHVSAFDAFCNLQVASGPSSPPTPRVTHAIPQAKVSVLVFPPPTRSSAQPNTTGLMTPVPKPTTERTA